MSGATPPRRAPLRVLITADAVGGVWDHVATLSRQLARRGHVVRVAALGCPSAARRAALAPEVGLAWADHRLEWMEGGLDDAREAARWIRRQAEEHEADVVHLNQLVHAPWIPLPTVIVVHSDVLSWHTEVRGEPAAAARWRDYARAVTLGLEAADAVAAPSRYQAELTHRHYGRPVDRVVWNGVEPGRGRRPPAQRGGSGPWPSRHGARELRVAVLGRAWDPAKGLEVLDRALDVLPGGRVAAFLAGDTKGPDGQAVSLRRVRTLGRLLPSQARHFLGSAHAYAGPSLYEPFGLAPVEAALEGCALVLSDIGSFRELWGDAAIRVPPGDARALAEALSALAADEGLRREMAAAAHRRAVERFDARRMAGDYEDLYQTVVGAPEPRLPSPAPGIP